MSVSSISSSSPISSSHQSIHNNLRQFQQEFQQLSSDLQSGKLSAARQDYATLRKLALHGNTPSPTQSGSPIVQTFHQLGQDLQSGNVSAVHQDYATLKQDFQNVAHTRNHHALHLRKDDGNEISQVFEPSQASSRSVSLSA